MASEVTGAVLEALVAPAPASKVSGAVLEALVAPAPASKVSGAVLEALVTELALAPDVEPDTCSTGHWNGRWICLLRANVTAQGGTPTERGGAHWNDYTLTLLADWVTASGGAPAPRAGKAWTRMVAVLLEQVADLNGAPPQNRAGAHHNDWIVALLEAIARAKGRDCGPRAGAHWNDWVLHLLRCTAGLAGAGFGSAFSQSVCGDQYLAGPPTETTAAGTIVVVASITAIAAVRGFLFGSRDNAAMLGGALRIVPNSGFDDEIEGQLYDASGSAASRRALFTVGDALTDGTTLLLWMRWSGLLLEAGAGDPAAITPGTAALVSGAGTGTPAEPTFLLNNPDFADRCAQGTIQARWLSRSLSDLELGALASSLDLSGLDSDPDLLTAPSPLVASGTEITSSSQVTDLANASRTWAPGGTGNALEAF